MNKSKLIEQSDNLYTYLTGLISKEYPCYACQGRGCDVCNGYGYLIN